MFSRLKPIFAVFLVVLAGCNTAPQRVGGTIPDKIYSRIVSLSPNVSEILGALELNSSMSGRTSGCNFPESLKTVPIVANPTPDVEKIYALQADIVIADKNLINPAIVEQLKAKKIDVKLVSINSLDEWINTVGELGDLLQAHTAASKEINRVKSVIAQSKGDKITPTPNVVVAMGGAKPWVAGTKSFQADVVKASGGNPLGPDSDKFVEVNPEEIVKWNPDIVFVSDDPNSYLSSPAWASTTAAKKGQIFKVNTDLLLRAGSRVGLLIAGLQQQMHNTMMGAGK